MLLIPYMNAFHQHHLIESFHADQHGQPGVDVQESRAAEGGGRAGGASDGDGKEGAWGGASRHADQHGQPGIRVSVSKSERRGHPNDGKVLRATEAYPWP